MNMVTEDGLVVPHVAYIGGIVEQLREPDCKCFWVHLTGGKSVMVEGKDIQDLQRKRDDLVAAVEASWGGVA